MAKGYPPVLDTTFKLKLFEVAAQFCAGGEDYKSAVRSAIELYKEVADQVEETWR